jgi:hypothetical protein
MEILKPGRKQTGWAIEITCTGEGNGGGGCSALLLVDQSDLYRTFRRFYDSSSETFITFTCAACGVETDLKNVPSGVRAQLPSKQEFFANRTP